MLLLECGDARLRHGPSHVLEWTRATYRLGELKAECSARAEGSDVVKRFWFGEATAEVREVPGTLADAGTGHAVWDASIALAMLLGNRTPRSAVELGCGCALPSAVLAGRCRVVATDARACLVESLRIPGVETRVLDWSRCDGDQSFDLVMGAEILYTAPDVVPLARALRALVAPRGMALLVSLARRRPLLETLASRLRDAFDLSFDLHELTGSTDDNVARVTVDDTDAVTLVVVEARRRRNE
ncbi:hypothetical protein CTAYLR_001124 [Chrysophaeum taylorii]|uniref:Uncharacterized protein n=1 Tax=Chrysophaeum taylorii TaxID=2483200 RepID=A0AAD7UQI3_9STRA|nr:hypothetical protein CTAYLR_001124 [Chrysophaeum taylorii]